MPKITLLPNEEFCPDGAEIEANVDESILDAALRNNIMIEQPAISA